MDEFILLRNYVTLILQFYSGKVVRQQDIIGAKVCCSCVLADSN